MSVKLRNSIKGNDNKYFLWCHIRHLNTLKTKRKRITKTDRKMVNDLNQEGIEFLVSKKDYAKIEQKNNICINVFCYENDLTYSLYVSDKKFENCVDLLLITDENKSHYVYIREFRRFMCNKINNNNNKKPFCIYFLQCFSGKRVLIEHKKLCLIINRKQSVKVKSGSTKFKHYFK